MDHPALPRTVATIAAWTSLALAPLPAQALTSSLVATGFAQPVYATSLPDDPTGRVFVLEQAGTIRIARNGAILTTPFLDITSQVASGGERGLLGLAFDPDFATNRAFYVNFTRGFSGETVVVRYTVSSADPNVADPASETVIVGPIAQPAGTHNGGCIQFGPDGYLYIGMGDGGASACTAQDGSTVLGKMLRVDTAGNAPANNPFVGVAGIDDRIWAFGLRNPWRFSFDASTGELWIGDVGSSNTEEINFATLGAAGLNYGWPYMEGTFCRNLCSATPACTPALTLPIRTVPTRQACAIVGGYVYRGCAIPGLRGTYFHSEFCNGTVWSFAWDGSSIVDLVDRTAELGLPAGPITSLGEDADGEILICKRSGGSGSVYRVAPVGSLVSQDAGAGSTGSNGRIPRHDVCGVFGTGNSATLRLRDAPSSSLGAVVFGPTSSPTPLPLPGFGSLVPIPVGFSVPITTDADGFAEIVVPGGVGGGPLVLFHQAAILDVALGGITVSNAVQTTFD